METKEIIMKDTENKIADSLKEKEKENKKEDSSNDEDLPEDDYHPIEYKTLLSSFEGCTNFAGMFAGFEAFIINEYVNDEKLAWELQWGLFFLILSFVANIFVAVLSLITASTLKWGFGKKWMIWIYRIDIFFCSSAGTLFSIAVLLYISQTQLHDGFKITVYVCGTILFLFTIIMFIIYMNSVNSKTRKELFKLLKEF